MIVFIACWVVLSRNMRFDNVDDIILVNVLFIIAVLFAAFSTAFADASFQQSNINVVISTLIVLFFMIFTIFIIYTNVEDVYYDPLQSWNIGNRENKISFKNTAISALLNIVLFSVKTVARDVLYFVLYSVQLCVSCKLCKNNGKNNNNNSYGNGDNWLCIGFFNSYQENLIFNKKNKGKYTRYYTSSVYKRPYLQWTH